MRVHEAYTSFNSQINQTEDRVSEIEDQLGEIKWEGKNRGKRVEINQQSLQDIWDYVKRHNLRMCTWMWQREWIQAGKYSSGYYPGKLPQPSKAGQYSSPGNTENTTKIFLKKSNPKAHNHQIHQGWNEGENAKGSQRERSGHPQMETHQTHSRSLGRNTTSQKRVGANIQHS